MLKKHKGTLLLTSFVILTPMFAGMLLWNMLPDRIPIHWNAAGQIDGYGSKSETVFFLPLFMLVLHWVSFGAICLDPKSKDISAKALRLVLWICPAASVITGAFIYATVFGFSLSVGILLPLLMGVIFLIIGNYLPKCKQNYTIGIKVSWALADEENWNATHRFAGWLWVIGGFILMIVAPFNQIITVYRSPEIYSSQLEEVSYMSMQWVFILIMAVLVLAPTIFSYCYYRRHKKGTAD